MICVQFHLKDVLKNASTSTASTTTTQNAIKYVYTRQCEVIDHTSNNQEQSYTEVQKGFYKGISFQRREEFFLYQNERKYPRFEQTIQCS